VVTEYKIQWRRKGQASALVDLVKGEITDYTITSGEYLVTTASLEVTFVGLNRSRVMSPTVR
jgi:hypothetical protein